MPAKKGAQGASKIDTQAQGKPIIYLEFSQRIPQVEAGAEEKENAGEGTTTTADTATPREKEKDRSRQPSPVPQAVNVIGQLEFELQTDMVPKTCENFRQLCLGAQVGDKKAKETRTCSYKDTRLLRFTNYMIQCGDVTHREDGKGQESIYGGALFDDEHVGAVPHVRGTLSMANSGPNTNGCQFFICLGEHSYLDPFHVSFGKLLPPTSTTTESGHPVLDELEKQLKENAVTDRWGKLPSQCDFFISACGVSQRASTSAPPGQSR